MRMTALARTSRNCKQQTNPLAREDVTKGQTASVQLKKNAGRESQGAFRQDELIDGKPTVLK
jgi:hypothetical protein